MRIVTAGAARLGPIRKAGSRQAVAARMQGPNSRHRRIGHDGPIRSRAGAVRLPE